MRVAIVVQVTKRVDARRVVVRSEREVGWFADAEAVQRRIREVLEEATARGDVAYVYGVLRYARSL